MISYTVILVISVIFFSEFMLIFGAIKIINFVCFHYAMHARMYVINVCFRRSPRWGGVYAFSSNCSARLPCTEDKLFVLYWMYKIRCVEVSLVLTYYLSLSDRKLDLEASFCCACVWRVSDVRVCECESANMRHVNWHGTSSLVSLTSLPWSRIAQYHLRHCSSDQRHINLFVWYRG